MGGRPLRRLTGGAALAAAGLALAGCGGATFTNVSFRNDLDRPVQLELCREPTCRSVQWRIGIDPGAVAVEQIRSGTNRRFLVTGPPETVYGCRVFRFDRPQPEVHVALSKLRGGCGAG